MNKPNQTELFLSFSEDIDNLEDFEKERCLDFELFENEKISKIKEKENSLFVSEISPIESNKKFERKIPSKFATTYNLEFSSFVNLKFENNDKQNLNNKKIRTSLEKTNDNRKIEKKPNSVKNNSFIHRKRDNGNNSFKNVSQVKIKKERNNEFNNEEKKDFYKKDKLNLLKIEKKIYNKQDDLNIKEKISNTYKKIDLEKNIYINRNKESLEEGKIKKDKIIQNDNKKNIKIINQLQDMTFKQFLITLQNRMYDCGLFSSDVSFNDFKKELEKLNISLKNIELDIDGKYSYFKQNINSFSKEKLINIFFYYYITLNSVLQNFGKNGIENKINKRFILKDEKIFEKRNNFDKSSNFKRSPSNTKNPNTIDYIKSITNKNISNIDEKFNDYKDNKKINSNNESNCNIFKPNDFQSNVDISAKDIIEKENLTLNINFDQNQFNNKYSKIENIENELAKKNYTTITNKNDIKESKLIDRKNMDKQSTQNSKEKFQNYGSNNIIENSLMKNDKFLEKKFVNDEVNNIQKNSNENYNNNNIYVFKPLNDHNFNIKDQIKNAKNHFNIFPLRNRLNNGISVPNIVTNNLIPDNNNNENKRYLNPPKIQPIITKHPSFFKNLENNYFYYNVNNQLNNSSDFYRNSINFVRSNNIFHANNNINYYPCLFKQPNQNFLFYNRNAHISGNNSINYNNHIGKPNLPNQGIPKSNLNKIKVGNQIKINNKNNEQMLNNKIITDKDKNENDLKNNQSISFLNNPKEKNNNNCNIEINRNKENKDDKFLGIKRKKDSKSFFQSNLDIESEGKNSHKKLKEE